MFFFYNKTANIVNGFSYPILIQIYWFILTHIMTSGLRLDDFKKFVSYSTPQSYKKLCDMIPYVVVKILWVYYIETESINIVCFVYL